VNEIDGSRPGARPLDAFDALEDLDPRGRRVFLRVDPFVLDVLADAATTTPPPGAPSVAEGDSAPTSPAPPAGPAPTTAPVSTGAPAPAAAPPPATSTLQRLLELEARVVLATHFTPEARAETGLDGVEALASRLSERLGVEVFMPDECFGDAAQRVIGELRHGQLCVLPDLAAARGGVEQKNDEAFARALASSADAYVLDAFSASHLEYASLVKVPRLLPRRALGAHCRRELETLSSVFAKSRGSVALALGGRTFSDKIDTLGAWLSRVDRLCIGGGVAMTLLAAAGKARADACAEPDRLAQARSLLGRARDLGVTITLPVDFLVQLEGDQGTLVKRPADVPARARILDIGPESAAEFVSVLGKAEHLLWWGPLGNLGQPEGGAASGALATLCARPEIMSVVMGGDTRRFVRALPPEVRAGIDLVSTGSAAARALLAGRRMPGIEAVRTRR
jgi:phosphoglycerate kinase